MHKPIVSATKASWLSVIPLGVPVLALQVGILGELHMVRSPKPAQMTDVMRWLHRASLAANTESVAGLHPVPETL